MAFALQLRLRMTIQTFDTLDLATLSTITGGAAQAPQTQPEDEGPPRRTWGQMGRDYGAACVTGAGQSLLYGGRPRSVRDAAVSAATGCAIGVGARAIEDVGSWLSGG
jgi:hypothetical protein